MYDSTTYLYNAHAPDWSRQFRDSNDLVTACLSSFVYFLASTLQKSKLE